MFKIHVKSKLISVFGRSTIFQTLFLILNFYSVAFSQQRTLKNDLISLKTISDSITNTNPPERFFLQFDKPYCTIGDTMWFKAYLLNSFLLPSGKSGIMYIDIANDSSKIVKQYEFPVHLGLTWGTISIDEKSFTPGTYILRAYTNWMRNFGVDAFFYKIFTVSGTDSDQLLVSSRFNTTEANGSPVVNVKLKLGTMDKLPFAAQPLTLQVMNAGKRLDQQKFLTGVDGSLDVNFVAPQKLANLTFVAENDKKKRLAVIPVPVNRPQNADVQFLPEGGNLVAGLPVHIGFKAIAEDGRGLDVSGVILDHTQKQVGTFKSLHKGMGSFDLEAKEGESYMAQVNLQGGIVRQYSLPPVKNTGTVLLIKNELQSDSLSVIVSASGDIVNSGENFFLIGRARGIVCYAAIVNFHESASVSKGIAKSLFPSGITQFTLMNTSYKPINERIVYIDHHDDLNIKFNTDKSTYHKRDSVGLSLKVLDTDGKPIAGNFSVAVTDDMQVSADCQNAETINTRFLLTSDLKGYIEQPEYYLSTKSPTAWQALDNLLLIQGWVGYDWAQVFSPPSTVYPPEREFAVTGHVTNVINKPVKGTTVMLFSKSPPMLIDTATDNTGRFVFDHFPKVDTPVFVLKAVNKSGKSFNVGINVDEIAPPVFAKPLRPFSMPWYLNIDSTLLRYAKNTAEAKMQRDFAPGGHVLKEVKIKAKKIITDSENLNGPGEADFAMDEKELEAAGKKTWLQLLRENIKGFGESYFNVFGRGPNAVKQKYLNLFVTNFNPDPVSHQWYFINRQPVLIIVDGISLPQILPASTFREMTEYLSHSAEDIKGLEVISSTKFALTYLNRYDPIDPNGGGKLTIEAMFNDPPISIVPSDIAFVEITTRGGHGPVIGNTPGMYVYKPLPLSWPKAFYKPKYTVKDTTSRQDLRSTIDWEPNVTTNANGEANIWFYTADKPSIYTVTIEGTDMNGHFGYVQGKIKVETGKDKTK